MATFYNVPTEELEERSLYMRLFRSWLDGEPYYHAAFTGQAIHRLLEVGHVEAAGQGYILTRAGMKAWAVMCVLLITRPSIRRESETVNQALRQFYDEGDTDVSNLINELRHFLTKIDSDVATVVRNIDKTVVMTAVRQMYAERIDKNTYRITDAGRAWMKENAAPVQQSGASIEGSNPDALIHRLLAGQRIDRLELTSKAEQEYMRKLQREVHVTVTGDSYVITPAGRKALENFGQDAPAEEKAAPAVTAFYQRLPRRFRMCCSFCITSKSSFTSGILSITAASTRHGRHSVPSQACSGLAAGAGLTGW